MPVQTIRGAVEWAPAHARVLTQPIVPTAVACTGQQQRAVVVARNGAGDPSTWVGTRGSGLGTRGSLEEARMRRRLSTAVAAAAACTGQRQPVVVAGDTGVGAGAGDAWVAEEKVWVGPGSVDCGRGMRPRRRALLSQSASPVTLA